MKPSEIVIDVFQSVDIILSSATIINRLAVEYNGIINLEETAESLCCFLLLHKS